MFLYQINLSIKHTHTLICTHTYTQELENTGGKPQDLPWVSDDWLNHPNLPFFFSVRSARVTPSCVMHASPCIQTQRHSRGTWGARMGCYQNGSEHTSTTGQQQYSKYQYPTMTRAAGATGAADTEEGRRTTWRAVSHWKRRQVTSPCTYMLQCKLKHLHVNMLVGAHVSSTDTKSQDGCWRKAVWSCLLNHISFTLW